MSLKYLPFASSLQMEKAVRNAPPLRQYSKGTAVALLQAALKDRGESLPTSFTKWGNGTAIVKQVAGKLEYELEFEYKFFDRYNWDAGKSVTFAGITVTDRFMGEFHRQGLAREFDCHGSFKRRLTWKKGEKIPTQQLYARGGR